MSFNPVPLSRSVAEAKSVVFTVDERMYPRQTVLRAVHSLAPQIVGQARAGVRPDELTVELFQRAGDLIDEQDLRGKFLIALGDFVLRDRLESETRVVRELVVRQAFECNSLQLPELDLALPGSDPLGLSKPDPETGREHGSAK